MNADFASVMVQPPRVRCIGVELLPFSLGHLLLLRATGSRYVRGECPLFDDLIAGAFICAHSWEENQRLLHAPLRRWLRLKVWGLFAGKFDVLSQLLTLHWHIANATRLPEQAKASSNSGVRYLCSEWETRLFAYLKSIGYSDREALNMPLALAHKLFVAYLEENDLATFKSRRDDEIEDRMTRIVEEMEAADATENHGFSAQGMETRIA